MKVARAVFVLLAGSLAVALWAGAQSAVQSAEGDKAARPAATAAQAAGADAKIDGDMLQWGVDSHRNNVRRAVNIPADWNIGRFDRRTGEWDPSAAKNIKWIARLGSQTYGNTVIAGGKILIGTNNGGGWLPRYPADVDLGVLLCVRESDGKFLWQHSSEKLHTGRVNDWELQGYCTTPVVEGDRAWFVGSRGEVICIDVNGFYDGKDDGPVQGEWARQWNGEPTLVENGPQQLTDDMHKLFADVGITIDGRPKLEQVEAGRKWKMAGQVNGKPRDFRIEIEGPRLTAYMQTTADDLHEADTIWKLDMMKTLGVHQHNMASCSPTIGGLAGDLLFICTSNGVSYQHNDIPAPDAPSFICLDKNTGEVLWTDKSPGLNILHGQWSSPTYGVLGGVPQVLFAGGDGWLYSFLADRTEDRKAKLLWKFDCNPKESFYEVRGLGTRNHLIGTPVIYDGKVYVAVGEDPEHGEGIGHLWCIDPTKRGDVSPELAFHRSELEKPPAERKPLPHRRVQAVLPEEGEIAVPNPNSAVVWHYHTYDVNGDGEVDPYLETMHRTVGTVAIQDDLLFVADFSGIFHCLDAKTGKVHWTHDLLAATWGSPLIVDGKVLIGDEDGDVAIFAVDKKKSLLNEVFMGNSVYSTPVVAHNVLYVSNKNTLFAIVPADAEKKQAE